MKKIRRAEITLLTPNGKTIEPMEIVYDDSEDIIGPKFEIILSYNGIEFKGNGADYLWTDALADLQMKFRKVLRLLAA